jgi:hypothetical protein
MPTNSLVPGAFVLRRRDGTGHLDRTYALDLRARSRANAEPNDAAFLHGSRSGIALAEQFGATAVATATSGEDAGEDSRDRIFTEESGGPFVQTTGNTEYAYGIDARAGVWREPYPTA